MEDQNNTWFGNILNPIQNTFTHRAAMATEGVSPSIEQGGKKQSFLGKKLASGLDSVISNAAQRNTEIISGIQIKLNPAGLSNMEILTSTIDKSGNIFRKLFAGLLSIGSDVMGFFAALWVDNFSSTQNWEKNAPGISNIFANFFSFIFAEKQNQPMTTI